LQDLAAEFKIKLNDLDVKSGIANGNEFLARNIYKKVFNSIPISERTYKFVHHIKKRLYSILN